MAKQLTQKAAVVKPVENKLAERDWVPVWYVVQEFYRHTAMADGQN